MASDDTGRKILIEVSELPNSEGLCATVSDAHTGDVYTSASVEYSENGYEIAQTRRSLFVLCSTTETLPPTEIPSLSCNIEYLEGEYTTRIFSKGKNTWVYSVKFSGSELGLVPHGTPFPMN